MDNINKTTIKEINGKKWFLCPACEELILLEPAGVGTIGDFGVECKSCCKDRMRMQERYYINMMTIQQTKEGGELDEN